MLTGSGVSIILIFMILSTGTAGIMIHGIMDTHPGILRNGHLAGVFLRFTATHLIIVGGGDTLLTTVTGGVLIAGDPLTIIHGTVTEAIMEEDTGTDITTIILPMEKEDLPEQMLPEALVIQEEA